MKEVALPNMNIRVYEEKIVTLQRKLEDLLSEDEELRVKASRGENNIFDLKSGQSFILKPIIEARKCLMKPTNIISLK